MGRTQVESRVETLPYSWYAEPSVAAAERDRIFRRSWQYAGHTGELAGPGSMFPTQVGGLPVVVGRSGGAPETVVGRGVVVDDHDSLVAALVEAVLEVASGLQDRVVAAPWTWDAAATRLSGLLQLS